METVISMSSQPGRFYALDNVLSSMAGQNHKIDRLVLNIESKFESIFPNSIHEMRLPFQLDVNWCEDVGPATKYIPTLEKFPNDCIITIDDDFNYAPDLISSLINASISSPGSIIVGKSIIARFDGFKPAPYALWPRNIDPQPDTILMTQGSGGCLIPPDSLDADVRNMDLYTELSFTSFSPWLWVHALRKNTPVVQIDTHGMEHWPLRGTELSALHLRGNNNLLYDLNIARLWDFFNMENVIQEYANHLRIDLSQQSVAPGSRNLFLTPFIKKYILNIDPRKRLEFVDRTYNHAPIKDEVPIDVVSTDSTNTLEEIDFIERIFSNSRRLLEFGSGASTKFALTKSQLEIVSVETSLNYIRLMEAEIQSSGLSTTNLQFLFIDIGPVKEWGRPTDKSSMEKWPKYSSVPYEFIDSLGFVPDLVSIHGRFRIATFCQVFLQMPGVKVIFHDYYARSKYSAVTKFIDPVDGVGNLAIFEIPKEVDHKTWKLASALLIESILDDD
jgi:hypothetical protein